MRKINDLSGQKFGKLLVLSIESCKPVKYKCLCDCGNEVIVNAKSLKRGETKSCGCLKKALSTKFSKDLVGKRFGRLTVVERKGSNKNNRALFLCSCSCGGEIITLGNSLLQGKVNSCGCLRKENGKQVIKKLIKIKHGLSNTRIYCIYHGIKQRCYNENNKSYSIYGGRGIGMCEEWRNDFIKFYNWAKNNGYRDNLTIERINVNGNYCPENCTWIPKSEQVKNRRRKSEW